MSLTGDALTDRLVPVASRLVGAVREQDDDEVLAAFAEADAITNEGRGLDDHVNGAKALCVVLAAMVPWDRTPADLMRWWQHTDEFDALVKAGVSPAVAAELIEQQMRRR